MQYCMNHPDEMSKLSKLKAQITEVKGIMMDNIEKVSASFSDRQTNLQMLLLGHRKKISEQVINSFLCLCP